MSIKVTMEHVVFQPTKEEYNSVFSRMPISGVSEDQKNKIFDILVEPETLYEVITVAKMTGTSPIQWYGIKIQEAIDSGNLAPLTITEKQFVGAVVLVAMKVNEGQKTGTKQRFAKGVFKSGEIYHWK